MCLSLFEIPGFSGSFLISLSLASPPAAYVSKFNVFMPCFLTTFFGAFIGVVSHTTFAFQNWILFVSLCLREH